MTEQTSAPPAETQEPQPEQVGPEVFLAARLRETLAEAANLRQLVAELQVENARYKAQLAQKEIDSLDKDFGVGQGTVLQKKPDGTVWRLPVQAAPTN